MSGAVRTLLDRHGLYLRRELGQNFLVDPRLAERLALLSGVSSGDRVIEVGTGLGVLTRALAARAAHVTTVEIDSGLVRALESDALLPDNVKLIHADALDLDFHALIGDHAEPVRVVANLPYSAATPLLRRLLDLRFRLADWSVMVQRELARRLVAEVGTKDYGSFAVLHRLTVDVQEQLDLAPGSFFPAPKVHSSFIRVWPRERSPLRVEDGFDELASVERVVRAAFAQRRKTILNCLRAGGFVRREQSRVLEAACEAAGIDPAARAETVEPERFVALARSLPKDGTKD